MRKRLHVLGFRYRLHGKVLPGKPDLVFPKYRAVIFINGCFWHMHDCHLFHMPQSRKDWWEKKLAGNRERDARNIKELLAAGWRVLIVWECSWRKRGKEKALDAVAAKAARWLKGKAKFKEIC